MESSDRKTSHEKRRERFLQKMQSSCEILWLEIKKLFTCKQPQLREKEELNTLQFHELLTKLQSRGDNHSKHCRSTESGGWKQIVSWKWRATISSCANLVIAALRERFGKFSTPYYSCTPLLKLERGSWLLQLKDQLEPPQTPPPPFPWLTWLPRAMEEFGEGCFHLLDMEWGFPSIQL